MRKYQKAMIIGGVTLAALVPAGLVAADQLGNGMGNGNGGRGNGSVDGDCLHDGTHTRMQSGTQTQDQVQTQDQIQARDGTGQYHDDSTGVRPMDGTGVQHRGGR